MSAIQSTSSLCRLAKVQLAYRLLVECGDYDNSVMGAVGEVYAEEVLGMEKAPKGTKGYDGWLNGRRLSVKAKVSEAHSDSGTYVSISDKSRENVDDLVVVFVSKDGSLDRVIGPFPLDWTRSRQHSQGPRYVVSDMLKAIERGGPAEGEDVA